jgi:tetratricopeptide (TPR) repeat protein
VAALNKLAGVQALNTDDLILMGNSQMAQNDFKNAAVTLEKAIASAEKAGRSATQRSKLLLALHQAYEKTNNDAKRMQTLHRLMVTAPTKDSFKWIASAFEVNSNRDAVVMISIYRLGSARNLLSNEHYAKYAETALDVSSPGEAVAALEKGMSTGAIKKDDRNNRLLADAKSQVEKLKSTLAQQEAEAKAIATGEPEAKLATAYYTLKNYSKAAEAAKRALEKKNLRRPDGVNMLLGIALAQSKKPAEARTAFKAATAANAQVRGVADLWSDMVG